MKPSQRLHIWNSRKLKFAKQNLFYLDMFGHYWCNSRYHIENRLLDSYLLILTIDGSGTVVTNTGEYLCQKMDLILIDSSAGHHYHANGNWEFYWLHFQGSSSGALVRYMLESSCDFTHVEETSLSVHSFIQLVQKGGSSAIDAEISVSAQLHQLLADMIRQALSSQRLTRL